MMLHEPERTIVIRWLEAGNIIQQIPFGISGPEFHAMQRLRGMLGHFKRFGARHVEARATDYIALGLLTVAQARIGAVWLLLREQGPMHAGEMERALGVKGAGRPSLEEVVRARAGEEVRGARFFTVRATGQRPPHWSDYLSAPQRAAVCPDPSAPGCRQAAVNGLARATGGL